MDKNQRDHLMMKLIAIGRDYKKGRCDQAFTNLLRVNLTLISEIYETQQQIQPNTSTPHIKQNYEPDFKINNALPWSLLKYGYCSYFALSYTRLFQVKKPLLGVFEYNRNLEKESLVHVLVQKDNGLLYDAESCYKSWRESVAEVTDIQFMELSARELSQKQLVELITHDIGFDRSLYKMTYRFVKHTYNV